MIKSLSIFRRCLVVLMPALLLFLSTACSPLPTPLPNNSSIPGVITPKNYGINLIVNPGAEEGPNDIDGKTPVNVIPGWNRNGDFDVLSYGTHGIVSLADPGPSNRGKNVFTGGPDTPNTSGSQNIDLSSNQADIENAAVSYTLSGYLGGYGDQGDNATLIIQFENGSGTTLLTAQIGPVTIADRHSQTELLLRTTTGKVPKGTVKAVVTLHMVRLFGTDNDGYADNLSLIIQKS